MFWLYRVSRKKNGLRYHNRSEDHLFGCNQGIVPKLVRLYVPEDQNEPYAWHVDVEASLAEYEAFVIDLKPKNPGKNLYQLRDAWGYSACDWTPAMLRLRGLAVEGDPPIADPEDFLINPKPEHENVFTFVYFAGTVRSGSLEKKWTPPGRSSTNSVLLWPDALGYFTAQIRAVCPSAIAPGGVAA